MNDAIRATKPGINFRARAASIQDFGLGTDKPIALFPHRPITTDAAVYRDGIRYLLGSTSGVSIQQFGLTGDIPVASAYFP